jgi:hypothetical protein
LVLAEVRGKLCKFLMEIYDFTFYIFTFVGAVSVFSGLPSYVPQEICIFLIRHPKKSRPALRPTQLPVRIIPSFHSPPPPPKKRLRHEVDQLPSVNVDIKKAWNTAEPPPTSCVQGDNFNFMLLILFRKINHLHSLASNCISMLFPLLKHEFKFLRYFVRQLIPQKVYTVLVTCQCQSIT